MIIKVNINVDEDELIKATDYSMGNLHDSNGFTDLLTGQESAAYADSAYRSVAYDEWLSDHGIENRSSDVRTGSIAE